MTEEIESGQLCEKVVYKYDARENMKQDSIERTCIGHFIFRHVGEESCLAVALWAEDGSANLGQRHDFVGRQG